jgi:hypothetical protein
MTATCTATLPNGVQIIKKTKVAYSHVVAVQTPSGSWFAARWSRSLPLAMKAAETVWPSYPDRRIIQVSA